MAKVVLVTGGARSGKSRFAEGVAAQYQPLRGYLATAQAGDGEMTARIERHRERRGDEWRTVEEPLDVAGVLAAQDGRYSVVLLDCITLWMSNLLFHLDGDSREILRRVRDFAAGFQALETPLVIVTNEVGMGIVPEHPLARAFRDIAGEANEIIAARADEVYVTISGLPLKLKG